MPLRHQSAKALSTTVGNFKAAMITDLWHHLTYDLRGAGNTGYATFPWIVSEMLSEIHTVQNVIFQTGNSFSNNLIKLLFSLYTGKLRKL